MTPGVETRSGLHMRYAPSRPGRIRNRGAERASVGDRLAGLDLLRLAAALAVLLFHFGYRGTAGQGLAQVAFPELAGLARCGFLGVDLFFIISGFVIAASAQGRTAWRFAVARLARLYPGHLACMTLTALVIALWGMPPHTVSIRQWLANLTMLSPALGQPFMDGAYWSIALELVFYAWIGLFIALGILERHFIVIVSAWLGLCWLNSTVLHVGALKVLVLTEYGPLFASGMLMHRLWRGDRGAEIWGLLGVTFLLGLAHAIEVQAGFLRLYGDNLDLPTLWLLHAGLYAIFAMGLIASSCITATPLVLALGGLTYPLYLVHQNAGYIGLDRLEPVIGRWPALALVIAMALAVSWAIWRHVEPRGRRLVQALAHRVEPYAQRLAEHLVHGRNLLARPRSLP